MVLQSMGAPCEDGPSVRAQVTAHWEPQKTMLAARRACLCCLQVLSMLAHKQGHASAQPRVTKVSVTEPKYDLTTMQVQHKPLASAGSAHAPPRRREADARHGWAEEYEVSVWDVPLRYALYQGASRWDKEQGNSVCSSSCAGPGADFC
jgi:hypothetical protein